MSFVPPRRGARSAINQSICDVAAPPLPLLRYFSRLDARLFAMKSAGYKTVCHNRVCYSLSLGARSWSNGRTVLSPVMTIA
jgi:hypothetical protein